MNARKLQTFLATQTPRFDAEFLKDFVGSMPGEPFIGRHDTYIFDPVADTLDAVRKISEGLAYAGDSTRMPRDFTYEKIFAKHPDYTAAWENRT